MLIAIAVLLAGGWWGASFERAWRDAGRPEQFYQHYFEPAVMIACGHGFTRLPARPPALDDFLNLRAGTFDCASMPPDVAPTTSGLYQSAWYYLMLSVGLTWWLFGVSWSTLGPLFGALFGAVLALSYALFRFGMGRPLALAATAAFAVSTSHLQNLPHLRDYAKAPFVLALILLMALFVRGEATRRRWLLLAGLAGLTLGIGYGFRTDLLACIPPLLATMVLFVPGGPRVKLVDKALAVGVVALVFTIVGWRPITHVTGRGGCQWHVTLLGLSSYFDGTLGIEPAAYDWGPYSDGFLFTAVGSHAYPGADAATGPGFCDTEYDRETAAYFATIIRHFPGDMATRAVASMVSIADLPAEWRSAPLPSYAGRFYDWRQERLLSLAGWGPLLVVPFLLLIASADLRTALWTLCMFLWFGALPMLQFSNRHLFHLEWMGWFMFGALASVVGGSAWAMMRRFRTGDAGAAIEHQGVTARRRLGNVLVVAACCALVGLGVIAARWFQAGQVRTLVAGMMQWTSEPVPLVPAAEEGAMVLTPQLADLEARKAFWVEYLRIDVDPAACGAGPVTVRYGPPNEDLSRAWPIAPGDRSVMTPVFQYFRDLTVPPASDGCIRAVFRAPDLAPFPVWMFVKVPESPAALRAIQSYEGPRNTDTAIDSLQLVFTAPFRWFRHTIDTGLDLLRSRLGSDR